jgi:hypothetical protein
MHDSNTNEAQLVATLGMAGWGVADPNGGDFLSDAHETPEAAIAAAHRRLTLLSDYGNERAALRDSFEYTDGDADNLLVALVAYALHFGKDCDPGMTVVELAEDLLRSCEDRNTARFTRQRDRIVAALNSNSEVAS